MPHAPITLTGEICGALVRPVEASGLGVMVLTGSSGRVDVDRASLFARHGAIALALKWWGGDGQAAGINEIPIEVFIRGVDRLRDEGCGRITLVGASYGAIAALLTATRDPRVEVVVAISPSAVVWQNEGPGIDGSAWPPRSAFSWRGEPLPFMVWDPRGWPPFGTPNPRFREMHEKSLLSFAEDVEAATIRVEMARADVILVAGGADALWPSDTAAREIAARLRRHGRSPVIIEHAAAGHSPLFPGEPDRSAPPTRAWGGSPDADRELGAAAWAHITRRLHFADAQR